MLMGKHILFYFLQTLGTEALDSILTESAKFAEEVLTPLQVIGDEEGAYFSGSA
jgi:hypothetical protein